MFGLHSQVCGFKELHCFGELIPNHALDATLSKADGVQLCAKLIARSKRDIWGDVEQSDIAQAEKLMEGYAGSLKAGDIAACAFDFIAKSQGKTVPCEQTPRNIFYAKQLLDFYPSLHIVHIVRDPRDVLASQKNRWKRKRFGGDNIPWSEIIRVWCNYHPHTITKLWKQANNLALGIEGHERFHMLRFEDVIESPEATVKAAAQATGVAFEPAMLQIAQVGSSHKTNADSTLGVAKTALNRWQKTLSPGEIAICESVASQPAMEKFGYQTSPPISKFSLSFIKQILKYPVHVVGVLASNPKRAWILLQAAVVKRK
ncbi:hypothetical protein GCM10025791_17720 [Halioxenophilus aromaticivorans]|uniref:Sulfotransferase n=2 Tax=Halioxenophilus aromaticivorans TaxID=1306992 RepID=A0AAV3U138_9ALTE